MIMTQVNAIDVEVKRERMTWVHAMWHQVATTHIHVSTGVTHTHAHTHTHTTPHPAKKNRTEVTFTAIGAPTFFG